jgi:hypothetical protein
MGNMWRKDEKRTRSRKPNEFVETEKRRHPSITESAGKHSVFGKATY